MWKKKIKQINSYEALVSLFELLYQALMEH